MKNITKQIKEAIEVNALWAISDFFYFIEKLGSNGFEISYWKDEENWATLSINGILIGYIWKKYPLIFVKEDYVKIVTPFVEELKYIVQIKSKDLISKEFTIDKDEDLFNRTGYRIDTKKFSANDFWFYTVN